MKWTKNLARLVMLLMIGVAIIALWAYCSMVLPSALAHAGLGRSVAAVSAVLLTLVVLAAAPALPIQILFPRNAIAAAVAIGWMPLACSLMAAVPDDGGIIFDRSLAWDAVVGCANWMVVVTGAWLAARWRLGSTGGKPA